MNNASASATAALLVAEDSDIVSLSHHSSSSDVDDVHSTSSLILKEDRFYDEHHHHNPDDGVSSRSGSRHSSRHSKRQEERHKKRQGIYGSEGDLLFKGLVASLLVMIGTAAGCVFLFGLIQGDLETTEKFVSYATLLETKSQEQAKGSTINGGVLATWNLHISSYATRHADTWPFHRFPRFQQNQQQQQRVLQEQVVVDGSMAAFSRSSSMPQSKVEFLATVPLVTEEMRGAWEVFSVPTVPLLSAESGSSSTVKMTNSNEWRIHRVDPDTGASIVEEGPGPYAPLFQMGITNNMKDTYLNTTTLLNWNMLSVPAFARAFSLAQHSQQPVLSEPLLLRHFELVLEGDEETAEDDEPYAILVNPILGRDDTDHPVVVVGALMGLVPFRAFFEEIITEPDSKGLMLVVKPSAACMERASNQSLKTFSFQLNGGSVEYLGMGDKHDATYDFHTTEVAWDPFLSMDGYHMLNSSQALLDYDLYMTQQQLPQNDDSRYCPYQLFMTPSDTFYNSYRSNTPRLFAAFLVGIFIFVYAILALYGHIVGRKDKIAHMAAQRAGAVVDMFFPQEIKNRLMEEVVDGEGGDAKVRGFENNGADAMEGPDETVTHVLDGKPIADLFPACTVFFGDIAGFTAWSSEREPTQVFTLLETIYAAFDQIAKKRRVFKVETIGDCYLAVTGIPDPQDDHAVRMCQFARDCMSKMHTVTAALELMLGPDTTDLTMRMGLHSGPVTAGVLRGRKSHFQLFGDTVNTAARMESTGSREKIQLSEATAELLRSSGNADWIKPRDHGVVAKGKGALATFWLLPRTLKAASSTGESKTSSEIGSSLVGNERGPQNKTLPPGLFKEASVLSSDETVISKSSRLVRWNVSLLIKLLEKVAAGRDGQQTSAEAKKKVRQLEKRLVQESSILEEVQESIAVSKKNAARTAFAIPTSLPLPSRKKRDSLNSDLAGRVMVPDVVHKELTRYVTKIASLHPENPFHNFEHASHVSMSTSKLLSRIVVDGDEKTLAATMTEENSPGMIAAPQKAHGHDTSYGITSKPLTQFSVVFSALIHDVNHPGVSNAILIKEDASVGDKYNHKSVAEQRSVDMGFNLLMEPEYQNLRDFIYTNEKELIQFRHLIVNSVIATDIFDKEHSAFRKARWEKAFEENGETGEEDDSATLDRKATIVLEHLIQASDVSHTMQHWHVYQKWNSRLFNEMYLAYKMGRSEANPALSWYKGELWFFDNYIIPLAKKLETCGVFGVSSDEFLSYALENRREWEMKGEAIVAKLLQDCEKEREDSLEKNSRHMRNEDS